MRPLADARGQQSYLHIIAPGADGFARHIFSIDEPHCRTLRLRLDELEHEAVLRVIDLPERLRARIVRIAQNVRRRDELEAVFLNLLDDKVFVDTMQRVGVARARASLRAVIDDAVNTARLERPQYRRVELVGIGADVEE